MFPNLKNDKLTLNYVIKQFFICYPVKEINWKGLFETIDWDDQKYLFDNSLNSELLIKYPVKLGYQRAFVKHVVDELESRNREVHDCVFDALGRLVSLSDSPPYFKHYLKSAQDNEIITLEENVNIISEGTTGLCSWQASIVLSEWCLKNKNLLSSKNILELGSGIGLTGLTVFKYCQPANIILTDCHPTVLNRLVDNVKLNSTRIEEAVLSESPHCDNGLDDGVLYNCMHDSSTITVQSLPWEEITAEKVADINVDVVLAADVVYDETLFHPLLSAISAFVTRRACRVMLACTERNKDTLNAFLKELVNQGLQYIEEDIPVSKYYIWSNDIPIRLFNITSSLE